MGALIALLPQLLTLMNNPAVQALLPMLMQLGTAAFPNVDPNKAANAATTLFDTEHTKWVQVALHLLGFGTIDVDGVYGKGTKDAVSQFQTTHGLAVDGWAGTNTTEVLRAELLKK